MGLHVRHSPSTQPGALTDARKISRQSHLGALGVDFQIDLCRPESQRSLLPSHLFCESQQVTYIRIVVSKHRRARGLQKSDVQITAHHDQALCKRGEFGVQPDRERDVGQSPAAVNHDFPRILANLLDHPSRALVACECAVREPLVERSFDDSLRVSGRGIVSESLVSQVLGGESALLVM